MAGQDIFIMQRNQADTAWETKTIPASFDGVLATDASGSLESVTKASLAQSGSGESITADQTSSMSVATASVAIKAELVEYDDVVNKPTLISSSAQIADEISGSIDEVSASLVAAFNTLTSNDVTHDLRLGSIEAVTSSYALESNISGSHTELSSSVESRLTTVEGGGNVYISESMQNAKLGTVQTMDLTVVGTITANEIHTSYQTASILYDSGSTKFGDTQDDTHVFTGSVDVTGSITATSFVGDGSGLTGVGGGTPSDVLGAPNSTVCALDNGSGNGGTVLMRGGFDTSDSYNGGNVDIRSGDGYYAGAVTVCAGSGGNSGGSIHVEAGCGQAYNAGNLTLRGGCSQLTTGGNVDICVGLGNGGAPGHINIVGHVTASNSVISASAFVGDGSALTGVGGGGSGGTTQGDTGTLSIRAADSGSVAGNAIGTSAVDLSTCRSAAIEVASGPHSVIGGGKCNRASGTAATVAGGGGAIVTAAYASVAGGRNNRVYSSCAGINGGVGNQILASSNKSGIVAGANNKIADSTGAFVGSGYENCICVSSTEGVIAGGRDNVVRSGKWGTVGGGRNNRVCAPYGGILSGCGNTVNHTGSIALGSDITSTADNHTFVNNLNVAGHVTASGTVSASAFVGDGSGLTGVGGGGTPTDVLGADDVTICGANGATYSTAGDISIYGGDLTANSAGPASNRPGNITIEAGSTPAPYFGNAGHLVLKGGSSYQNYSGKVCITGGTGGGYAGGDVIISGGAGSATGNIFLCNLPTSAPATTGAVWNCNNCLVIV